MKITELETFVVGNPPPHFGGRYFIFLKLVTDDGIEGIGEVYAATFGPHTVARMIEDVFARHVVGADPFRIERLWRDVYGQGYSARPDISLMGVLSGIEMACWDIVGKAVDKPVYELLGGRVHERLRGYTYLYRRAGDATDVYLDPDLAAERAAEYLARGLHGAEVRSGGALLDLRPAPAGPRGARPLRALREEGARGGRRPLRPPVRHPRPVHPVRRDPPCEAPRAVRPAVVRGADAARDAGGDGAGRARDVDPDRDRRAADDEVRVLPRARDRRRLDPAAEPRPGRRPARGEEDRRHGRGALRPDRAPPLLRPGRRRRQHPAQRVQPELPHPRGDQGLGRLPRRDPEDADPVGGRLRDPTDGAGARRRARRGGRRAPSRTRATSCT